MKLDLGIKITNGAGFGPAAWVGDSQKVSMHPPIPGHIEFVEEEIPSHRAQHHVVQRRHPENDNEFTLIRTEITPEDMGYHPYHQHHLMHKHQREKDHKVTAANEEHKEHAGKHRLLHHRRVDSDGENVSIQQGTVCKDEA